LLLCLGYREVGVYFITALLAEILLEQQLNFALFVCRKFFGGFDHIAKNHLLAAFNVIFLSMIRFAS
jgi:hypothetical protein